MGSTATRSARALDVDAAERALRNARSVSNDGRPRQAHALYARLRERLPADAAPHVAVRTLLGLATTGYELDGDADRAMALLDDARSRADAAADGRLQVAVGGQIGLLHLRRGRTDDAIAAFDRISHGLDGADPHDSGAVLINRGVLWLDQLSLRRARSDFAHCSEVAAGSGDLVLESMARHNLGYVEFLAGDLPQALADMAASARVDPGAPRPTGMLDETRVMVEAGLSSDAEARLAAAQEVFGTQGLVHDVAETECARAEVAITERRWADARRLSRSARRAFARRGNGRWGQNAHLLELRARLGTIDDAGAPLTAHRAARTELVRIGRDAVELAASLSAAGRRDAARTALLVAIEAGLAHPHPPATGVYEVPSIRSTDPLGLRLHVRRVRARQAWARRRGGRRA